MIKFLIIVALLVWIGLKLDKHRRGQIVDVDFREKKAWKEKNRGW